MPFKVTFWRSQLFQCFLKSLFCRWQLLQYFLKVTFLALPTCWCLYMSLFSHPCAFSFVFTFAFEHCWVSAFLLLVFPLCLAGSFSCNFSLDANLLFCQPWPNLTHSYSTFHLGFFCFWQVPFCKAGRIVQWMSSCADFCLFSPSWFSPARSMSAYCNSAVQQCCFYLSTCSGLSLLKEIFDPGRSRC